MRFPFNTTLLEQARNELSQTKRLFWVVGGAGSGKTTICKALANSYGLSIYDMDAHIYGDYHGRFSPERHPVNSQWAAAPNGLAWLLAMSWEQFDAFNKAAVPEYLDLLAEDLQKLPSAAGILIDGGIANPAVAAQAFPVSQMVCLARLGSISAEIWSENDERLRMKEFFKQFPNPEQVWQKFLVFDQKITETILDECRTAHIPICQRTPTDSVAALVKRVAQTLACGVKSN